MAGQWMRWSGRHAGLLRGACMEAVAQHSRGNHVRGWPRGARDVMHDEQEAGKVSRWLGRRERLGDWSSSLRGHAMLAEDDVRINVGEAWGWVDVEDRGQCAHYRVRATGRGRDQAPQNVLTQRMAYGLRHERNR